MPTIMVAMRIPIKHTNIRVGSIFGGCYSPFSREQIDTEKKGGVVVDEEKVLLEWLTRQQQMEHGHFFHLFWY
jgi:hypothetical protein